ncbi:class II D-tagatose-bisphosphate aldolase, non-catalytic subunit [Micromonospora sp. STR1_7]|uniref:Class II D-tagatose-bisphosphate aldolase, non-catalytic subunit n=1 Tax=Micromonospora parastrephiae TaxID=2806101 RepID=A0ABS1XSS5_9ACTN|nr:class II D-tagatose-bisphosphate aldolase, non-catalytic subunit [Micromonospora parastrephiae]MBM0232318.1 class II D-tagatose-bisphosphate aldolase, non-catalytic subunit [Micromonospora parastrephiae]
MHPLVTEAAVAQSFHDGAPPLSDATSNQVDQLDGYPGMRPSDLRDLVLESAERTGTFKVARSC